MLEIQARIATFPISAQVYSRRNEKCVLTTLNRIQVEIMFELSKH